MTTPSPFVLSESSASRIVRCFSGMCGQVHQQPLSKQRNLSRRVLTLLMRLSVDTFQRSNLCRWNWRQPPFGFVCALRFWNDGIYSWGIHSCGLYYHRAPRNDFWHVIEIWRIPKSDDVNFGSSSACFRFWFWKTRANRQKWKLCPWTNTWRADCAVG